MGLQGRPPGECGTEWQNPLLWFAIGTPVDTTRYQLLAFFATRAHCWLMPLIGPLITKVYLKLYVFLNLFGIISYLIPVTPFISLTLIQKFSISNSQDFQTFNTCTIEYKCPAIKHLVRLQINKIIIIIITTAIFVPIAPFICNTVWVKVLC